jgi:C4-type Zn-finger protein
MQCPRCTGLMVFEQFINKTESNAVYSYDGWRCVVCGEILDEIIIKNRTQPVRPELDLDDEIVNKNRTRPVRPELDLDMEEEWAV